MAIREKIEIDEFKCQPTKLWSKDWLLLTAGKTADDAFNTMTVAWGGFGVMWHKPIAMIVVRPQRYTLEFLEKQQDFTLSAFDDSYRQALAFCGANSGRDSDKIAETGLTPIPSDAVSAPAFEEANLIIQCRNLYFSDFDPAHFMDASIEDNYAAKDYHRMFFGEIVGIECAAEFRK